MLRTMIGVAAAASLWLACSACNGPPEYDTPVDPELLKGTGGSPENGLVWMFPGVIGTPGELNDAYKACRDAGLRAEVRVFAWQVPWTDFFFHLIDLEANLAAAASVADEIVAYHDLYPEARIDLVGYSAGGALCVLVAQALPEDVRLHNVVLAQPGLSPMFDLTPALRCIDGRMIVFYSPIDEFVGEQFTSTLGTIDRYFGTSAAKVGFDLNFAVSDAALRAKVWQIAWTPAMEQVGHPGTHLPILQYRWNRYMVAPLVVPAEDWMSGVPALDALWDEIAQTGYVP